MPLIQERQRKREQNTYKYVPNKLVEKRVVAYQLRNRKLSNSRTDQTDSHPAPRNSRGSKIVVKKDGEKGTLWLIVTIVAVSILLLQLYQLSDEYLMYQTETDVVYSEPIYITMPGVSICFDPVSLINDSILQDKFPSKKIKSGLDIYTSFSIGEIFDLTPSNESIIIECNYKTNDSFALHSKDKEGCAKFYEVVKYQKLHRLCYTLRARQYWLYFVERVMQGLEEPGTFEDFILNLDTFINVTSFFVVIHNHWFDPRGTNLFPSYVSRIGDQYLITSAGNRSLAINTTLDTPTLEANNTGNGNETEKEPEFRIIRNVRTSQIFNNLFSFNFAIYCNSFLKPPYAPNCYDYLHHGGELKSQEYCYDVCLDVHLKNLTDRIPDSSLVSEIDFKSGKIDGKKFFFSSADYDNTTLVRIMSKYQKLCSNHCHTSCEEKFYDTHNMDSSTSDKHFIIKLLNYKSLPFYTFYNAKLSFSQFLVQFLSCFGIWITVDFTTIIHIYTAIDNFFRIRMVRK